MKVICGAGWGGAVLQASTAFSRMLIRADCRAPESMAPLPAETSPTAVTPESLAPGTRVRITKQVAREGQALSNAVEGTVVACEQRKTGSWFAHSKDDKLWLDRLEIHKDDGEVYVCNVDAQTRIEIVDAEGGAPADTDAPEAGA